MERLINPFERESIHYFVAEKDLINRIVIDSKSGRINFNLFSNLIATPVGFETVQEYSGFYIATCILRKELGFDDGSKPGDFDILIIPFQNKKVYFDRTCAIEVKVVRPIRKKTNKSPDSNGIEQVNGLIRDGFPLVGLIHICMPEPLPDVEKRTTKFDITPINVDDPSENMNFLNDTIDVKYDPFPLYSSINQMKRLISKDIPKFVGLRTLGVSVMQDKTLTLWFEDDFNYHFGAGYFNPYKKTETISKIEHFWKTNPNLFKIASL